MLIILISRFRTVAAARLFKARAFVLALLALACQVVAAPATAQVNYAVSGSTAYVTSSPNASGAIVIASTFNGFPVTSIADRAFEGASSLTSVIIPNGVTSIGGLAFHLAYSLTNVTIPNSVTSIGTSAFRDCGSLMSVIIPDSVTSIGDSAFLRCNKLTSVTIPDGVTSIRPRVFTGCRSLSNVIMGSSVTSIGHEAFLECASLTSVTIPNSVTSIGQQAFHDCTSLTNVTIPNSVTMIGQQAFGRCRSLASVTIPNSVTSIGQQGFYNCTSLTSVTIPNSVTSIGQQPFFGCTSLTNLSVDAANPAYRSVDGILFDKAQTTLITYPAARVGGYVIPGSVTIIATGAFAYAWLTSVTIPDSVTSIGTTLYSGPGGGAFYSCTGLTNVIIGNSVTNIGYAAFYVCSRLTSLTIPASVTNIGGYAFGGCTSLTNFTFLGNAPRLVSDIGSGGYHFMNAGMGAKAYYYCGTTGWGGTYGPLPTVMLCPPGMAPGSAGVKPGGFGFTLTRLTNQTIVVEASANLVDWQPIWTNSLPGTSADFVDPAWLQHPARFYRARSE